MSIKKVVGRANQIFYMAIYIAKFLHEHQGCPIKFVNDENIVTIKSKLLKEYEEDLKFELSKEKFFIKQKHGLDSRYTGKLK